MSLATVFFSLSLAPGLAFGSSAVSEPVKVKQIQVSIKSQEGVPIQGARFIYHLKDNVSLQHVLRIGDRIEPFGSSSTMGVNLEETTTDTNADGIVVFPEKNSLGLIEPRRCIHTHLDSKMASRFLRKPTMGIMLESGSQ